MRGFALCILMGSALCVSALIGSAVFGADLASSVEAAGLSALLFLAFCIAVLLLHIRHMDAAMRGFEKAAQDHIIAARNHSEDLGRDLDTLGNRFSDLKRDFVAHLAEHADIKVGSPGPTLIDNAPALPTLSSSDSIASAIRANRIDLFVQPTVTLPARKTVFYECLSRLRSEAGETLYPNAYLKQAARSRLIGTLDNFLLLRCVHIIRKLYRKAPLETFFLNISAASLNDPDFYDQFIDFLSGDRVLAEYLVLELQANDIAELLPRIGLGLERLSAAGYKFALDGATGEDVSQEMASTGFSYIKIPARVVAGHTAPQTLVGEASALSMTLIATHVEDEKTLIDMAELGVSHAQGYLIAKPTPWDAIDRQKQRLGAA